MNNWMQENTSTQMEYSEWQNALLQNNLLSVPKIVSYVVNIFVMNLIYCQPTVWNICDGKDCNIKFKLHV